MEFKENAMKALAAISILIIAIAMAVLMVASVNDNLVDLEEKVNSQWGTVETQYQRRMDLIPNLVSTVKGYAQHEEQVLTEVTSARAAVGKVQIDIQNAGPEEIQAYMVAQGQLSGALSKLLAVVEAYPDLKAGENFLTLQAQLEGTENRITVERRTYNLTAEAYNGARRKFFTRLVVDIAGMEFQSSYPYFEADEGADKAPTVSFE